MTDWYGEADCLIPHCTRGAHFRMKCWTGLRFYETHILFCEQHAMPSWDDCGTLFLEWLPVRVKLVRPEGP